MSLDTVRATTTSRVDENGSDSRRERETRTSVLSRSENELPRLTIIRCDTAESQQSIVAGYEPKRVAVELLIFIEETSIIITRTRRSLLIKREYILKKNRKISVKVLTTGTKST